MPDESHVGRRYGPFRHTVEGRRLVAFAEAIGDVDGQHGVAPPTYAAVYCLLPVVSELVADVELGIAGAGLIHGQQGFEWGPPVRSGDVLEARGEIESVRSRRGMALVTVRLRASNQAGDEVCRGTSLLISRAGTEVESPGGAASSSEADPTLRATARPTRTLSAQQPSADLPSPQWEAGDAAVGGPGNWADGDRLPEVTRVVSQVDIVRYAEASGDHNPIHVDAEFARASGLPGAIAHGMLEMGILATALHGWAGPHWRLAALSCRFSRPLPAGDTLTCGGTVAAAEADGTLTLALEGVAGNGDHVLTQARATLRPAGPG